MQEIDYIEMARGEIGARKVRNVSIGLLLLLVGIVWLGLYQPSLHLTREHLLKLLSLGGVLIGMGTAMAVAFGTLRPKIDKDNDKEIKALADYLRAKDVVQKIRKQETLNQQQIDIQARLRAIEKQLWESFKVFLP